jgi:hypothetical protein
MNSSSKSKIQVTKKLKPWNEGILSLHPSMPEIIQKDESDISNTRFICLICKINNAQYSSILVRNLKGHFEESKAHYNCMAKEKLLTVNQEIIKLLMKNKEEYQDNLENNEIEDTMKISD